MQLSSGKTIWGKPEMKPKIKLKICIDILMTAALLFLMPYELVGRAAHVLDDNSGRKRRMGRNVSQRWT